LRKCYVISSAGVCQSTLNRCNRWIGNA
jgi:hypothetical protein